MITGNFVRSVVKDSGCNIVSTQWQKSYIVYIFVRPWLDCRSKGSCRSQIISHLGIGHQCFLRQTQQSTSQWKRCCKVTTTWVPHQGKWSTYKSVQTNKLYGPSCILIFSTGSYGNELCSPYQQQLYCVFSVMILNNITWSFCFRYIFGCALMSLKTLHFLMQIGFNAAFINMTAAQITLQLGLCFSKWKLISIIVRIVCNMFFQFIETSSVLARTLVMNYSAKISKVFQTDGHKICAIYKHLQSH